MVAASTRAGYQAAFYSWALEQARLVREGQWTQLDRTYVAEEIESLAKGEFNKFEAAVRALLLEILKWDHKPGARSRCVVLSIELQRIEVQELLSDNPGMRPRAAEATARAYRRARLQAAKETELDDTIFPETCAYAFDEIMMRQFVL